LLFLALLGAALFVVLSPGAQAQMTCIECHADPGAGGFHGGFRVMTDLTTDQIDVVCLSCHDGSYTSPGGALAVEAAVHENIGEYGTFKAGCLDCHANHSALLAGDASSNTNLQLLGPKVVEANSTDGIARIRKPVIDDVNGDNGGTGNRRYEDDLQIGWECNSGVKDDPSCIETVPPAAGDGVRRLAFYLNIETAGTNWAQTAPPYNGACNTCHTRTEHHRRDDSDGDHSHNVTKNCDQCHNHNAGWVNKGG
jgi:hypothetical protein